MTSKPELRRQLRLIRQDFVSKNNYFEYAPLHGIVKQSRCVASYAAAGGEPDVAPLAQYAQIFGVKTALPWIDPGLDKEDSRAARLLFRQWTMGAPLVSTALGFIQPEDDRPDVIPDLILTPLLGFDALCNRLGQGAGHYDRAFEDFPDAIRIGIAWSVQELAVIPTDAWDLPLDAVLTELNLHINPTGRLA